MTVQEIITRSKEIAGRLPANNNNVPVSIETVDYSKYGWTQISFGYGTKLFRNNFVLLSIPNDNPQLRYFENDEPKILESFEELEKLVIEWAERVRTVKLDGSAIFANYD